MSDGIQKTLDTAVDFAKANPELINAAVAGVRGLVSLGSGLLADLNDQKITPEQFVNAWQTQMQPHFKASSDNLDAAIAAAKKLKAEEPADTIQGAPV